MRKVITQSRRSFGASRFFAVVLALTAAGGVGFVALGASAATGDPPAPEVDSISEKEVLAHLEVIASPGMEGRDTPSEGQARAAAYLVALYTEFGFQFAPDSRDVMTRNGQGGPDSESTEGSFYRPYMEEANAPDPDACALSSQQGEEIVQFKYGADFVPVHRASGSAKGELVFGGFAIDDNGEKYNDFKSIKVHDKVVLLFSGEPRHKKKFDGAEPTQGASLFAKLALLNREGAAGALIVQRPPEGAEEDKENKLDYRYSHAAWNGGGRGGPPRQPSKSLPTLEISLECASRLLGTDADKLAKKMDASAKPTKVTIKDVTVQFTSQTSRRSVRHDNVLGILPGTDPELSKEYVLVGAHFDHIGVGDDDLVGCGADDNGSGVSAFLEVAQAFAKGPPRRSVIFANFSGEEDGLVGARKLAAELPVAKEQIVCMVNLDMIGFGDAAEVAVLGTTQNPKLEDVLDRAKRLGKTGLRNVVTGKGEDLWERSDHYAFHSIGLPVLFFFEGLPITNNKNYHTWRDTIDGVDTKKIANTARMVYNTVWILANDDDRPPAPRE